MAPVSNFRKSKCHCQDFAQNPAYKIFISDPRLRNEYIVQVEDADPTLLPEMVFSAVKNFQPDGVLCGVSGPGNGVDECLLKTAHDVGLRRFAFQDYWGYINPVTTHYHDVIFVVDKHAKELTNVRTFASVEIVGNPKYDCYKDLNISALQARFIEEYGLSRQDVNIGFIGQPLGCLGVPKHLRRSKIISEMGQNIRCFTVLIQKKMKILNIKSWYFEC